MKIKSNVEKIQTAVFSILEMTKHTMPSLFRPGTDCLVTKMTDLNTGRKVTVFGEWGEHFRLGDNIEVVWVKDEYTLKNKKKVSWKIIKPTTITYAQMDTDVLLLVHSTLLKEKRRLTKLCARTEDAQTFHRLDKTVHALSIIEESFITN